MIIAMCTALAMMAAPTTKVSPAKISGIWQGTTCCQMLNLALLQKTFEWVVPPHLLGLQLPCRWPMP